MRLAIDERSGCIAVVDLDAVASPGLGPDYPGVLWFALGRPIDNGTRWTLPASARREARVQIARLAEEHGMQIVPGPKRRGGSRAE